MKRSAGVTASAVIVFVGSSLMLFAIATTLLGLFLGGRELQPVAIRYMMLIVVVIEIGFAAWGFASGVGLLRLREWARISMLVFSGILILMSLPGIFVIFVIPLATPPNVDDPEMFRHIMLATRFVMAIVYGLMISTAAFWLYFFNTRSVRDQFKGIATAASIVSAPGVIPEVAPPSRQFRVRPLSISIIAWYLVVTCLFFPLSLVMHVPAMLLWFVFKGTAAGLILVFMSLFQIVIGIALLKQRGWSRILAICYFAFLALNSLTMVLAPGAQARYQEMTDEMQSRLELSTTEYGAMSTRVHIPIWVGLIFSLPLQGVVLWFLVKNKPAFTPSAQQAVF